MELLTPRELSQTTEVQTPTAAGNVTIPDPSDTLGNPVVKQTMRELVEAAGRLVAYRSVPGSGVTAPCGTIDNTGRVLFGSDKKYGAATTTKPTKTLKAPDRKIKETPIKKVFRVLTDNQIKNNFTRAPDRDMRACFNRSTWSPAVNMQQTPLETSQLILGDSLVRILQNSRTSWITTVMAFGGATVSQLYRMALLR